MLFVIDAGRGISALASAVVTEKRYRGIEAIRIFVTHAHMDHWEGLKDSDWFWIRQNGLDLELFAPAEALDAIERAHEHPAYVALDRLAIGTLDQFGSGSMQSGDAKRIGDWTIRAHSLNHFSGGGESKKVLDTAGFRFEHDCGAVVAYLSDHQPSPDSGPLEHRLTNGAHLMVYDSTYPRIDDHAYGHGSIEYAAKVSRSLPGQIVLAAHHGPASSDRTIFEAHRKFGKGLPDFHLAIEGDAFRWSAANSLFVPPADGRSQGRASKPGPRKPGTLRKPRA